ncbi:MAG: NTP transferase domain-containing protein [Bryobacterales bacterium]|nr:NTP transferase domain-containing protein [Bryobacterales bacterium]
MRAVPPVHSRGRRWGVVLAGGDGRRLLPLTRRIAGDDRPKQFCAILGGRTLLEETRSRVRQLLTPARTWTVVTKPHERFYSEEPPESRPSVLLVQPDNRGTAPAIAYSLVRLRELDPEAVVAFFPSDHHFSDEESFRSRVGLAFDVAEHPAGPVVLLGIVPDTPDVGYGWVEPGAPLEFGAGPVFRVRCFWEKPALELASALMQRGCLWNSFVMAGRVTSFLNLMRKALPGLLSAFDSFRRRLCTPLEESAMRELYPTIRPCGFSDEVLTASPEDLAVVSCGDLGWSDLGESNRVLAVLRHKGIRPKWADEWVREWQAAS